MMTVHELATEAGVTTDTVRHYVRIGLLRPQRNPENNYQLFSDADLRQLCFVRKAKLLGFTLREICWMVDESERGRLPCKMVRETVYRRICDNREKLAELAALQRRMEAAVAQWNDMPDCETSNSSICDLIEAVDLPEEVEIAPGGQGESSLTKPSEWTP